MRFSRAVQVVAIAIALLATLSSVQGALGDAETLCPDSVTPLAAGTNKAEWTFCHNFGPNVNAFWNIDGDNIVWRQECNTGGAGWCAVGIGGSMATARTYWGVDGNDSGDTPVASGGHTGFDRIAAGTDVTDGETVAGDGDALVFQFERALDVGEANGNIDKDATTSFFVSWGDAGDENTQHGGGEYYSKSFDIEDPNPAGGGGGPGGGDGGSSTGTGGLSSLGISPTVLGIIVAVAVVLIIVGLLVSSNANSMADDMHRPVIAGDGGRRPSNGSGAGASRGSKASKGSRGMTQASSRSRGGSKGSKGSKGSAARMTQASKRSRGSKGSKGSKGSAAGGAVPRRGRK